MRVGIWNVQTMKEMGKLTLLVNELDRNITGLCEVRWEGEGSLQVGEHTVVYHENEKTGSNGVAIVLDKRHSAEMKSFNAVNDRIVIEKINTKHGMLNVIQVYVPACACTDDEIEEFCNNLQTLKDNIPQ
ncbi:craniofacial development protein 2-like [Elysia marginata]|uniref:Craniofacial development protein 2-like n=1 Tax=Elysia marginata TaxID=1093978 RepID=A0AAV4HXA8_9GAST|nr:craniofacial development protein 2-like [Elysia marginata]